MASKESSIQPSEAASSVRRWLGVACFRSWIGPIAMRGRIVAGEPGRSEDYGRYFRKQLFWDGEHDEEPIQLSVKVKDLLPSACWDRRRFHRTALCPVLDRESKRL